MATLPRRRWSKELPPDLSDLMKTLVKYADSFIREFDNEERYMTRIEGEFQKIANEVEREMETMNKHQRGAAIMAGTAAAIGLLAAPFTGGLSMIAGGVAVGAGVACVSTAIIKTIKKNGSATKIENLGKEFMKIVEPLRNDLEQIKTTCKRLEQESSAKYTLEEMKGFEMILRRVSELGKQTEESLNLTERMTPLISRMVMLVTDIITLTVSTAVEDEFIKSVIQSAVRCQKIIHEFQTMKKELKEFI